MKVYNYINRVDKRFHLAIFKGMKMHFPSRRYASPWIDLACAYNFFCFPCNVPQHQLELEELEEALKLVCSKGQSPKVYIGSRKERRRHKGGKSLPLAGQGGGVRLVLERG